jgi:hypothetical protein
MEWLKQNYERAALIAAALVLIVCSGLIINNVFAFPTQFSERNTTKPQNNTIKPLPVETIATAVQVTEKPRNWAPNDASLYVSRPYVLRDGKLIDPLATGVNLHEPITNSWVQKYDLPYWEGDLKDQDPDGDRFTNLDEFLANTDPRDKDSVPPYYTKLRLGKFISVPFRLIFTSSPDEGQTFAINTKDKGGRTQFLEMGATIEGTPYKLLSYAPKKIEENEIEKDVSELTIENTETGQKIILVANKEANDPTSFAEFVYLYDGSKFKVKKDDEFTLTPETDRKYKLIDISEREALIKDLKSGESLKISPEK